MHKKTLKLWMGIGTFALLGAGADAAETHGDAQHAMPMAQVAQDHQHMNMSGGEGGEGGEGGHEDDAFVKSPAGEALVGRLLLLKGHLVIGRELYEAGIPEDAAPHYLHPTEEIYSLIEGELKKRKLPEFGQDLKDLAALVKETRPAAEVGKKQDAVLAKVNKALAGADRKSTAFNFAVVKGVLDQAADEYKDAFDDGVLTKAVEYQDARGFITAARAYVKSHGKTLGEKNGSAYKALTGDLDALAKIFPTAVPPKQAVTDLAGMQAVVAKVDPLESKFH